MFVVYYATRVINLNLNKLKSLLSRKNGSKVL